MIHIDLENGSVFVDEDGATVSYPLDSPEAFEVVSRAWLRCGWDNKYVYSFTWLGRPVIQMPEDLLRLQEVISTVQPDVIVETGVAHGGSLVFYATLCKALGRGRGVGVDVEIRPHNRQAIEAHTLSPLIKLIEGSSTDPDVVSRVQQTIGPNEKVLVILDSCHTKDHVLAELEAYRSLVSVGSYLVVQDGCMEWMAGAPQSRPDWGWNNPMQAAHEFVARHHDFAIEEPPFAFNEGNVKKRVSYWPDGFIRRLR